MLDAFMIVLREGFEAFLIVAITLTYLNKTNRQWLKSAVYVGIVTAAVLSAILGFVLLRGINQAFWEGVIGLVAAVLVASLVIHLWRTGPRLKQIMEGHLERASAPVSRWAAFGGVFLFTVLMITREGMETALMLYQVRGNYFTGAILGLMAAITMAWLWSRYGSRINLRRFFQVTGIYLILFTIQILIYSFHELAEAEILPRSEEFHAATEPLSPTGIYGKWFSLGMVGICGLWLLGAWWRDRNRGGLLVRPGVSATATD
ncbi:MAG TPA: FTR1 family protein [Blastocatellia bacterium]|nr:FTR1 family protein [Blastocatellia bacterium]